MSLLNTGRENLNQAMGASNSATNLANQLQAQKSNLETAEHRANQSAKGQVLGAGLALAPAAYSAMGGGAAAAGSAAAGSAAAGSAAAGSAAAGSAAAGSAAAGSAAAGSAAGGMSAAAAVPYVGWAVAAGALAYSLFS